MIRVFFLRITIEMNFRLLNAIDKERLEGRNERKEEEKRVETGTRTETETGIGRDTGIGKEITGTELLPLQPPEDEHCCSD